MADGARHCTLFVCGDVMTGRGIDQIMPNHSQPHLYEPVVRNALEYVDLAERAHGPVPRDVDSTYVWGDALDELAMHSPAARIINLETSITTSEQAAPKQINYRMHPANVGVLTAAHVDCAVLANNHVLDWGVAGLVETLDTLNRAGIRVAGAGRTAPDAQRPAIIDVDGGRVLIVALGGFDSGVPPEWAATPTTPGVYWTGAYSAHVVRHVADIVGAHKQPGDIVVVSIHWGSNWGYDVPSEHRRFAHALIEHGAADLIFGHSSHHPKGIEVYRNRAILYGCGDFLNDYEGISNRKPFRDDLALMYFPTLDLGSGELQRFEMVPMLIRNFRLVHPPAIDVAWLTDTLDHHCRILGGARIVTHAERMQLEWR